MSRRKPMCVCFSFPLMYDNVLYHILQWIRWSRLNGAEIYR